MFIKIIQKNSSKNAFFAVFAFLLASCGSLEDGLLVPEKIDSENQADINLSSKCATYNERFTDCEITSLYTDRRSKDDPSKPESLRPKLFSYPFKNAPSSIKNEWEFGYYVAGFKGYINVGKNVGFDEIQRIISHLQKISGYKNLTLKNGNKVFTDSHHSDSRWNRVPDEIDGQIDAGGEFYRASLKLKAQGFNITVKSGLSLSESNQRIQGYLSNVKPVSVTLIGKVLDVDGIRISWEFYPYRNGFLVYGASVITPNKFKDDIAQAFSTEFSEAVYDWLLTHID